MLVMWPNNKEVLYLQNPRPAKALPALPRPPCKLCITSRGCAFLTSVCKMKCTMWINYKGLEYRLSSPLYHSYLLQFLFITSK